MPFQGKILITGANGFVGANLAHRFVRLGLKPRLLVRKKENAWRLQSIQKNTELFECDLTDEKKLDRVIQKIKPAYVLHSAAHGGYSFQTDAKRIITSNFLGTFHLLNACMKRGFKRFIHCGSSSEYGFKDKACDEETPLEPNSIYAVSKASATLYCQYVGRSFKTPVITFRLYSVYGPYEEPQRFIPTLIRSVFQKKSPRLVNPDTARDFIHIEDVVDAHLLAMTKTLPCGEIFNLATGKQSTVRDVVRHIMKITGAKFRLNWGSMAARTWDTNAWSGKNDKLRKAFGWQPRHDLKTGLRETVKWYEQNPGALQESLTAE